MKNENNINILLKSVCGGAVAAGIAVSGLNLIGFSSIGPISGSIAANYMSSIGIVAAGSSFAVIQSITMTPILIPSLFIGGAIATCVYLKK